ncbi:MAG: VOC family protein, partial [Planctomycetota bacterium]
VDFVILLCDDLAKMQAFYTDIFGFQIEDVQPEAWAGFRVGSLFLGLRPRGRPYDGPAVQPGSASVQLSFRVPPGDVDLAHEALVAKGVEIIEAPTDQDWCHRTLFFRDPENNVLEIYADIHPGDAGTAPSTLHRRAER